MHLIVVRTRYSNRIYSGKEFNRLNMCVTTTAYKA